MIFLKNINDLVQNHFFEVNKSTQVKSDAAKQDMGQIGVILQAEGRKPVSYASTFLHGAKLKYSNNVLEILAVTWALMYYRNYLIVAPFKITTDPKALLWYLSEEKKTKTTQTQLVRRVDQSLPFDYELEHIPGKIMWLVDYLSRYPVGTAPKLS